jgi:hypothetical protein
MAFYPCPTSPHVNYRLRSSYTNNVSQNCVMMEFLEVLENGVKKFIVTGTKEWIYQNACLTFPHDISHNGTNIYGGYKDERHAIFSNDTFRASYS